MPIWQEPKLGVGQRAVNRYREIQLDALAFYKVMATTFQGWWPGSWPLTLVHSLVNHLRRFSVRCLPGHSDSKAHLGSNWVICAQQRSLIPLLVCQR